MNKVKSNASNDTEEQFSYKLYFHKAFMFLVFVDVVKEGIVLLCIYYLTHTG